MPGAWLEQVGWNYWRLILLEEGEPIEGPLWLLFEVMEDLGLQAPDVRVRAQGDAIRS